MLPILKVGTLSPVGSSQQLARGHTAGYMMASRVKTRFLDLGRHTSGQRPFTEDLPCGVHRGHEEGGPRRGMARSRGAHLNPSLLQVGPVTWGELLGWPLSCPQSHGEGECGKTLAHSRLFRKISKVQLCLL